MRRLKGLGDVTDLPAGSGVQPRPKTKKIGKGEVR